MTDAPEYLRAGDIARLTGVSLRTVRRWIAEESAAVGEAGRRAVGAKEGARTTALARTARTGQSPKKKSSKTRGISAYRENTMKEHVPSLL